MNTIHEHKTLFVLEGIGIVILGMLAIALPVLFTIAIDLLIGSIFLIGGIFQFIRTFKANRIPGFIMALLTAIVYVAIGILLIYYPMRGVLTLTMLLTIFFILEGIAKIVWGFKLKPLTGWGWLVFSGVLALAMGAIIIAGWPGTALWVMGLLVGIDLIFFGFSLITLALAEPNSRDQFPR